MREVQRESAQVGWHVRALAVRPRKRHVSLNDRPNSHLGVSERKRIETPVVRDRPVALSEAIAHATSSLTRASRWSLWCSDRCRRNSPRDCKERRDTQDFDQQLGDITTDPPSAEPSEHAPDGDRRENSGSRETPRCVRRIRRHRAKQRHSREQPAYVGAYHCFSRRPHEFEAKEMRRFIRRNPDCGRDPGKTDARDRFLTCPES